MRKYLVVAFIVAIALVPAFTQENIPDAGSLGIMARVSQSDAYVGVMYHFSNVFAIRPWIGFSLGKVSDDDKYGYDISTLNYDLGIDLLYELKLADSFLIGLGGEFRYYQISYTNEYDAYDDNFSNVYYNFGPIVSAQYFFNPVLGIYTDVGFYMSLNTYTNDRSNSNFNEGYTDTSFGFITSSLGVVYYIK